MSAFEKLQNYSARHVNETSDVFDINTPEGAFLNRVHKEGYKMYVYEYTNGSNSLSEKEFNSLSAEEQSKYKKEVKFTELHDILTTCGNQEINAIAGSGKALVNGTRVLTRHGFVPIEQLEVLDEVYGEDGKLHSVLGVFPQGKKQEMRVVFNDNTSIPCCKDHIWTVYDYKNVRYEFTTQELLAMDRDQLYEYNIPYIKPIVADFLPSVEERKELIKNCSGILDEEYAEYIADMARSLGYFAQVRKIDDVFDVKIRATKPRRIKCVYIDGAYSEMTCIKVDNPSHLFITENYTPTHNTTALVFKIIHDIVTGEVMCIKELPNGNTIKMVDRVWVCTFLRTGASELESALASWQKKLGYSPTHTQLVFSTLDAEFKRCLNSMGVATNIASAETLNRLLKKAIDICGVSRSGNPLTKEDYSIISGIITYARGRLDEKKYTHPSCADYGLTPAMLDMIIMQFAMLRQQEGVMDFDEIQELLYKYLYVTPNKAVQDFVANRYKYIYVDEFQDTSQMQYAILKFYARGMLWLNNSGDVPEDEADLPLFTGCSNNGKITAIGDVSQCIYSFKGSDSKILAEHFDKDFRPVVSTLSCNWRCPSNILEPVVSSIHLNDSSKNQKIFSAHTGGEFEAINFASYATMVDSLKTDLKKDIDRGYSVAILCRTNFDGVIPAFVLGADNGFDFSISGSNMTLNSALPRKILAVTSLFTERSTPSVKQTLSMFVDRYDKYNLNKLMDTLKLNNMSFWQVPESDIQYSVPSLYDFYCNTKKIFYDKGARVRENEIDALCYCYKWLKATAFSGDSAFCNSARAYIDILMYLIETNGYTTIFDFLEDVEYINDKLNGRIHKKNANIQIATVHEFKGKECDSVYVWNDSEGVFPSSKCDVTDVDQLEEERRVHYIACTRAKKSEKIYTLAGRVGMFVKEMSLSLQSPMEQ